MKKHSKRPSEFNDRFAGATTTQSGHLLRFPLIAESFLLLSIRKPGILLAIPAIIFSLACTDLCPGQEEKQNSEETQQQLEQPEPPAQEQVDAAITNGVARLIELQHEDGAWPYEGVYRVGRQIPVGYRIGGTAIVCEALLYGSETDNEQANNAIKLGVELITEELKDRRMRPSTRNNYDVRVWGHIYALDFYCRLLAEERFADLHDALKPQVEWLTQTLLEEQIDDGGWNYANQVEHAPFVTAPAIEALLLARESGQTIEPAVFLNAINAILSSRAEDGAMAYSGRPSEHFMNRLPGSIARTPVSEFALTILGRDRSEETRVAINAFHQHWEELEKRRKQDGTHLRPYGVAPYYFYYGHRYIPQAIRALPEAEQAEQFSRFNEVLLRTLDEDGTWNDRVFEQSKAYGTAMAVLGLLGNKVPVPAVFDPRKAAAEEPEQRREDSSANDGGSTDGGSTEDSDEENDEGDGKDQDAGEQEGDGGS